MTETRRSVSYTHLDVYKRQALHVLIPLPVPASVYGLVIMLGYNFYAIMPGRLVQFAIMIPIYCVLTCLLYFSPLTAMVVGNTCLLYTSVIITVSFSLFI